MDPARLLLRDALVNAFGARALDADGNAGVFRFERASKTCRGRQLERGVKRGFAFLARGLDQRRRHGARRRSGGLKRLCKDGRRAQRGAGLEDIATRYALDFHGVSPGCRLPLRGRSDAQVYANKRRRSRRIPKEMAGHIGERSDAVLWMAMARP